MGLEEEEVNLFDDEQPKAADTAQAVEDEVVADAAPAFEIPEKFAGKSVEEVVESYVNLEKEAGRRANEVGELRKLTDQILQQQVADKTQEVDQHNHDVGFDDFIDDPTGAVNRAVENNPRLQALENSIQEQNTTAARTAMHERHTDVDDVVASTGFQSWVQESPSRLRNFQRANAELDIGTAGDLIDLYKQTRKVTNSEAEAERNAKAKSDLKKATVEKGGLPASTGKVFKRAELIRLKMTDPSRYSSMIDEITEAYAEGRVK